MLFTFLFLGPVYAAILVLIADEAFETVTRFRTGRRRENTMRIQTIAVIALLLVLSGYPPVSVFASEAPRMEKDMLKTRLGQADVIVIDVRAITDAMLEGKIMGSVRENPKDFDEWYGKYSKRKIIVLYCA